LSHKDKCKRNRDICKWIFCRTVAQRLTDKGLKPICTQAGTVISSAGGKTNAPIGVKQTFPIRTKPSLAYRIGTPVFIVFRSIILPSVADSDVEIANNYGSDNCPVLAAGFFGRWTAQRYSSLHLGGSAAAVRDSVLATPAATAARALDFSLEAGFSYVQVSRAGGQPGQQRAGERALHSTRSSLRRCLTGARAGPGIDGPPVTWPAPTSGTAHRAKLCALRLGLRAAGKFGCGRAGGRCIDSFQLGGNSPPRGARHALQFHSTQHAYGRMKSGAAQARQCGVKQSFKFPTD